MVSLWINNRVCANLVFSLLFSAALGNPKCFFVCLYYIRFTVQNLVWAKSVYFYCRKLFNAQATRNVPNSFWQASPSEWNRALESNATERTTSPHNAVDATVWICRGLGKFSSRTTHVYTITMLRVLKFWNPFSFEHDFVRLSKFLNKPRQIVFRLRSGSRSLGLTSRSKELT